MLNHLVEQKETALNPTHLEGWDEEANQSPNSVSQPSRY